MERMLIQMVPEKRNSRSQDKIITVYHYKCHHETTRSNKKGLNETKPVFEWLKEQLAESNQKKREKSALNTMTEPSTK